jgi:CheY-like chemotaxis protein
MSIFHSDQHSMQVLIADDDLDIATLYKKALERRSHNVTITSNGEDCLKRYLDALHHLTFGVSLPGSSMSEMPTTKLDPSLSTGSSVFRSVNKSAPYDVVILDYSMPSIMDVAKEILAINSHQSYFCFRICERNP